MAANNAENSNKTVGTPFEKGKSGNPGGRPKMDDETKAILKAAAPDAARLLVEMMNNPVTGEKTRLQAAQTVLDRVYGKATQPIEGAVVNLAAQISEEDAQKALEALGYERK